MKQGQLVILVLKVLKENSHKNNLIYDVSYKTFMGENSLRIRLDKMMELDM